ncbi:MAG: patatin-like phospholipase family protein [Alicyclobacillaceae bacterium]|nr:patatin-like phospholipase family protein [Alicyclobacillaceae bacterium]
MGVALGAGGAKGLAHIGVLKALEEHGLKPEAVSGSSMGSLVGAMYATGMTPWFMERLACALHRRQWIDMKVSRLGLIAGEKVREMVALLTRRRRIEEADIPLAIVATDLMARAPVVFTTGPIADAVRASIAIPGVFIPVMREGRVLVDGGVLERVPVSAARWLGVQVVVGVDVSASSRSRRPTTLMDVVLQSIDLMQDEVFRMRGTEADVLIVPDLSGVGTSEFHKAQVAIQAGYQAALERMADIRSAVQAAR